MFSFTGRTGTTVTVNNHDVRRIRSIEASKKKQEDTNNQNQMLKEEG